MLIAWPQTDILESLNITFNGFGRDTWWLKARDVVIFVLLSCSKWPYDVISIGGQDLAEFCNISKVQLQETGGNNVWSD